MEHNWKIWKTGKSQTKKQMLNFLSFTFISLILLEHLFAKTQRDQISENGRVNSGELRHTG